MILAGAVYPEVNKGSVLLRFAFGSETDFSYLVTTYPNAIIQRPLERTRCDSVVLILADPSPSEMPLRTLEDIICKRDKCLVDFAHIPARSDALRQWFFSMLSSNKVSHKPRPVSVRSRWFAPRTAETE